ncbi:MAG: iron ABC transporter substrate-binding protein [Dehalococcoidia bacterium]|nr:iron ABC transporter substrate-binding protein [Dehalococcoidia bacterium]
MAISLLLVALLAGCSNGEAEGSAGSLTIYSGRSESLVGPIIEQFGEATGIKVSAKYAGTSQLAATLLEEGDRTPADMFFAQDAGGLGAVEHMLAPLPEEMLQRVPDWARSLDGKWIGLSGRARAVVYNTEKLTVDDLPDDILDFAGPEWKGRIGWPLTNASFQASITAMRLILGEDGTRQWLEGIVANKPRAYKNNSATVQAVAAGEVDVGFVNHYYLFRFLTEEGPSFPARNHYPRYGGAGTIVNVAGVGILATSNNTEAAQEFVEYLLSEEAQLFFADTTFEYPLVAGIPVHPELVPLDELDTPDIDLSDLSDLEGTLKLLLDVGLY